MIFSKHHKLFFWSALFLYLGVNLYASIIKSADNAPAALIINEILASNGKGLTDQDDDLSDWVEIYNQSDQDVNLAHWALSNNPTQLGKWVFPECNLKSRTYLLVFASGKDIKSDQPETACDDLPTPHTNFRLKKEGDFLALYNLMSQRVEDKLEPAYPPQLRYISYGRHPESNVFGYSPYPSPGHPNDASLTWAGVIAKVEATVGRGFYDHPFQVALHTSTPEVTIRYTLDGSKPTETHGEIYTEPISINTTTILRAGAFKPTHVLAEVNTFSYIFLDEVLHQAGMDPRIARDASYAKQVRDALTAIPSISLVAPDDTFHIYANALSRGRIWERGVSIELIYPPELIPASSIHPGFQINNGLRMHGSRGRMRPKASFRLYFRGIYGSATKLDYPLFPTETLFPHSPVQTFEKLVLRAGGNSNYTGQPEQALRTTYTRDEWLRASQIAMSGVGSHGTFVHLYLNGLYWGLYNLVERPDAAFMASYYGGHERDWSVEKDDGPLDGSEERFATLKRLIAQGGLDDPERYTEVAAYLDIDSFIDHIILNWYAKNTDWPERNWYIGVHNPAGQVKYFVWDGEKTWVDKNEATELFWQQDQSHISLFFNALRQNPRFKTRFAERLSFHLFDDGALSTENAQARWMQINQPVEQAILGEIARWGVIRAAPESEGDAWIQEADNILIQILQATDRRAMPQAGDIEVTLKDWQRERDAVLEQMETNVERLLDVAREQGFYPIASAKQ